MATWKTDASRTNKAHCKGPVGDGIYSDLVVLGNEDADLYNQWRAGHLAEWAPATETEYSLVIDIVDARWRLRRLTVLETKALDFEVDRMRPEVDEVFSKIDEGTRTVLGFNSLLTLNRTYEVIQTSIRSQHRIVERATNLLLKLAKLRPHPDGGPGATFGGPVAAKAEPEPAPEPPAQKCGEQTRQPAPVPRLAAQKRRTKPGNQRPFRAWLPRSDGPNPSRSPSKQIGSTWLYSTPQRSPAELSGMPVRRPPEEPATARFPTCAGEVWPMSRLALRTAAENQPGTWRPRTVSV